MDKRYCPGHNPDSLNLIVSTGWRIFWQGWGVSQQGFREGLAPRRYAAPLNPQALKPRQ